MSGSPIWEFKWERAIDGPLWSPMYVFRRDRKRGLSNESWAKVDDVKSVSIQLLEAHLGGIGPGTLSRVEEALRLILEI